MRLHQLKPNPGARHRVKRLGCGESSGHGKTSGKGHKGQKARSGGSIRLGFEGGQMPLIRRLPKRGFNNAAFKTKVAIVNLDELNQFSDGMTISTGSLKKAGVIRGKFDKVKVLGRGKLNKKLNIKADLVSKSAAAKVQNAGGSVVLKAIKPVRKKGITKKAYRQALMAKS